MNKNYYKSLYETMNQAKILTSIKCKNIILDNKIVILGFY